MTGFGESYSLSTGSGQQQNKLEDYLIPLCDSQSAHVSLFASIFCCCFYIVMIHVQTLNRSGSQSDLSQSGDSDCDSATSNNERQNRLEDYFAPKRNSRSTHVSSFVLFFLMLFLLGADSGTRPQPGCFAECHFPVRWFRLRFSFMHIVDFKLQRREWRVGPGAKGCFPPSRNWQCQSGKRTPTSRLRRAKLPTATYTNPPR